MVLNHLKDAKGISIIEVLVSIVIIGALFVSYMAFYANGIRSSVNNQDRFTAMNLAQLEIESYKQFDISNRDRNSEPFVFFPIQREEQGYIITTSLIPSEELPNYISSDSNYIPIRVTVAWANNQSITMDCYLIRAD